MDIFGPLGFEQVALPKKSGALTSAPIISNGTDVFGFMDYQSGFVNFLEELANGKQLSAGFTAEY